MNTHAAPLLDPTPPAEDRVQVEAIFNQMKETLGFVPDGLRLYGISPPLLNTFVGNVAYFRGGTALSPVLTTLIRYLVSSAADCQFCIDMNEAFLDSMGVSLEQARAARQDLDKAPLEAREKLLLQLATRAVENDEAVTPEDLDRARAAGWSDREIFDAVVQAASNRAFNHVLRTFGIEQQGAFG